MKNDSLGVLELAGQFLPEHPAWYKIRCSKTCLRSLESIKSSISLHFTDSLHLHDGETDGAETDGGFQGGHCLGVGQSVQAGLVHLQQEVPLLKY